MIRRLEDLADRTFDVVVIGGGILGACVARDAALRGLATAIVEAGDFAGRTSGNSLKVIHGGLRHLQHLDVPEVRACAEERSAWLRIAPHLVAPLPVLVPLFGPKLEIGAYRAALAVNDALTSGRNRGLDEDRRIPPGRTLSRRECIERVPELDATGVTGGVLYHDAQAYSTERLVLEVVESAVEAGACAANYVRCRAALDEGGRRAGIVVDDQLGGGTVPVRARVIVNAAGPTAPTLTARLTGRPARHPESLSLAWNLVLEGTGHDVAFALPGEGSTPTAGSGGSRPRRLFVVPWRGRTLLGTGHARFEGDPHEFSGLSLDHPELRAFLEEANRAWPGAPLDAGRVRLVHAGLLPAIDRSGPEVQLLRKHVVSVERVGGAPVVTATTVKLTAARRVAESAVDRVCRLLAHGSSSCRTAEAPLPGAPTGGMAALARAAHTELDADLGPDAVEHLVRSYGTRFREVVADGVDAGSADRPASDSPVIRGQFLRGVRQEMACTTEDLLFRRTEPGARGAVTPELQQHAASVVEKHRRQVPR